MKRTNKYLANSHPSLLTSWSYDSDNDMVVLELDKENLFLGFNRHQFSIKDIYTLINRADRANFIDFIQAAKDKKAFNSNLRIVDVLGKNHWHNFFVTYDRAERRHKGYVEQLPDLAHQNVNLAVPESHFDKIEQISKTGSFRWTLSDDELTCSQNFFQISELKNMKDGFLDKNVFFNIIDVKSQNFVLDVMHECITHRQEFDVSFKLAHSKNKRIRIYGYPIGDIKTPEIVGIIQDITDQIENGHAVLRGQDIERKRISLDIHDSVGQKLIAVKYKLALMKMMRKMDGIDELNTSMSEIIDEIRAITHNLSSQIVTELGLKNALSQLLNETTKSIGAKREYHYEIQNTNIPDDDAKMLYRIVQECLSNALKHSKAKMIGLTLKIMNQQIVMKISDDGVGFKVDKYHRGIGLQNIKERVTSLNGFLKIISAKNQGSTFIIKIPLANGYSL